MKKISLLFCFLFSGLVIYFFAKDRWIGYAVIPDNKIFDERDYALQGISLRTNGVPIGYSDSGDYMNMPQSVHEIKLSGLSILINGVKPTFSNFRNFPKPVYSINKFDFGFGDQHVRFVQPFFDHPPLGGFVYSLGLSQPVKDFLDIKPDGYRKPALYLAIISSILIFCLAYQVFDNPLIATLSTIVYNIVPTYLLVTRYALLENIVAPLSLLMINLFLLSNRYRKKYKVSLSLMFLSGLIAGFTVLAKETGVGFLLGGIILLIIDKAEKRRILLYLGAALLPVTAYVLWGLWLAPNLFTQILFYNATRSFLGSLNFINIFTNAGFKNFMFDGWWIWGFISVIFLVYFGKKKALPLTIPLAAEILVILFLSGINFPWYYFALIPYLSMAAGYALWKLMINPDSILLSTFFLFPLSSSFYWGYTIFNMPPNHLTYRLVLIIFAAAAALRIIFFKTKTHCLYLGWAFLSSASRTNRVESPSNFVHNC